MYWTSVCRMACCSACAAVVKATPCRGRRRANRGLCVVRVWWARKRRSGRTSRSVDTASNLLRKESWKVIIHREAWATSWPVMRSDSVQSRASAWASFAGDPGTGGSGDNHPGVGTWMSSVESSPGGGRCEFLQCTVLG